MAIAFDAKSNSGEVASLGSPFQKTWSHTVGSISNGILLVLSSVRNSNNSAYVHLTGVTYNGVALTKATGSPVDGPAASRYLSAEIWYLLNPASGTNNIVATYAAAVDTAYLQGASFSGVAQVNPIDANASLSTTTGNPWTTSITTVTNNDFIVNVIYSSSDFALSANNGETVLASTTLTINHNPDQAAAAYKGPISPAAATTTGWNNSGAGNDEGAMAVVALKPAATTVNSNFLMFM